MWQSYCTNPGINSIFVDNKMFNHFRKNRPISKLIAYNYVLWVGSSTNYIIIILNLEHTILNLL